MSGSFLKLANASGVSGSLEVVEAAAEAGVLGDGEALTEAGGGDEKEISSSRISSCNSF